MVEWIAEATCMALSDGKEIETRAGGCCRAARSVFSGELKERVARWLTERRAQGAKVADLAAELGLCEGTVLRWSTAAATKSRARALVPVVVVSDRATVRALSVISPSGFRVDGVSFEETVDLLRALG